MFRNNSPNFLLTGGAVIFEDISVLACTTFFRDVVSLGSMILQQSCLTMNFSFIGIK